MDRFTGYSVEWCDACPLKTLILQKSEREGMFAEILHDFYLQDGVEPLEATGRRSTKCDIMETLVPENLQIAARVCAQRILNYECFTIADSTPCV
jgi:hypothetical protein